MMERFKSWLYIIRFDSRCNRTDRIIEIVGNVFWVSKEFALVVKNYIRRFRCFSI